MCIRDRATPNPAASNLPAPDLPEPDLPAPGQTVSLFADSVRYDPATGTLQARGNVEAFLGANRLTAQAITFDPATDTVTAEGEIRLDTPDGTILLASLAQLSADYRAGLVQGARVLLDNRFQIAAVEAQRSAGRYNTFYKTVASSCSVCADRPTPLWRIRARQIVHDEEAERLYFEDAWFDVLGTPIAYVPRLRMPAPGVTRASGLLLPDFSTSDFYGFGAKLPYFFTLGPHADATVTPFLTTGAGTIVEGEYRQRLDVGAFRLRGAVAVEDRTRADAGRGFINAAGAFALPRGFRADASLLLASDKDFLRQFGYSEADRLASRLSINRYGPRDFVDIRVEGVQSLRETERQGQVPLTLPRADIRRVWYGAPLPGRLGLRAGLLSLVRAEGRDGLRLSAGLDWRLDRTFANGMLLALEADLAAEVYSIRDDAAFSSEPLGRVTPSVGVVLRWPFIHYGRRAAHVLEPVVQLAYSDTLGNTDIPNEDSLLAELDETNLFTLNRFPGLDERERGLRVNYALGYTRYDPAGWNIGMTLGQVIRTDEEVDFPTGSGLRTRSSDFAAAVTFALPPSLSIVGRSLFNTSLSFRRAEFSVFYETRPVDLSAAYTLLAADDPNTVLGPVPRREELAMAARYRFAPNWELDLDYTYDIAEARSVSGAAGVTYGNDCAEIGLSVSRRFTTSNNVPPTTLFSLELRLAGIGASEPQDWPATRCGG